MAPLQYVEVELTPKDGLGRQHGLTPKWAQSPVVRRFAWTGSMILCWWVAGDLAKPLNFGTFRGWLSCMQQDRRYILSMTLGAFNKKIVGKDQGLTNKGAFPAPLLMSGVQFLFQALLARAVFGVGLIKRTAPQLPWRDWCRLVLPNGTITGLDIGLSNKSLVHITMSFYTMCKSTTPVFLLVFAFAWGLETPSWSLAGVVGVIVTGLLLLVKGEAKFDATGFALVMTAACMSGLRFTLTQVLLHGKGGHGQSPFGSPLEVLEALTPVMCAATLLMSLATEQLWEVLPGSPYFAGGEEALATAGLVFLGAVIAFLMVWAEFEVIRETSALTCMVAGIIKEILTIGFAIVVFGDSFGALNGVGLAIAIFGVGLYNLYRLRRLREGSTEVVVVRRPGSGDTSGGGNGGSGGGGDAKDASPAAVPRAAGLVPRAGSSTRGVIGSASGSGWRREGGGGGGPLDRRRSSGGSNGEGGGGSSGDEEEGLEQAPLLLSCGAHGGGGSGGWR